MVFGRVGQELAQVKSNFRAMLATLIASAFGFVAALFWNDAVKSTIDLLNLPGGGILYKYMAAIIVTVVSVLVIYFVSFSFAGKADAQN